MMKQTVIQHIRDKPNVRVGCPEPLDLYFLWCPLPSPHHQHLDPEWVPRARYGNDWIG